MFSQQIHELIKVMMSMSVIIPLPSSQRRLIHILKSCALCSHLCIWSISSRISLFSSFHPLKSSCTICDTMQCTHTQKLAVFQHFFFSGNPNTEQSLLRTMGNCSFYRIQLCKVVRKIPTAYRYPIG